MARVPNSKLSMLPSSSGVQDSWTLTWQKNSSSHSPSPGFPLPTGGLSLPKAFPATTVPPPSDFHRAVRLGGSKKQEVYSMSLVEHPGD